MRAGLLRNVEFLEDLVAQIVPHLSGGGEPSVARDASSYSGLPELVGLLTRDWGGLPEGEKEIEDIAGRVRDAAASLQPSRVLFLGGGLGRHAFELARLGYDVSAVELSVLAGALFANVRDGSPRAVWEFFRNNALSVAARQIPLGDSPDGVDRLDYVIADAAQLPFGANEFDLIVSCYFTDVLPLSFVIPEARRVLRPGGHFLHVGPLGYHHRHRSEQFTVPEFLEQLVSHGFRIAERSMFETSFLHSDARMVWLVFRCLFAMAVREDYHGSSGRPLEDRRLQLARHVRLDVQWTLGPGREDDCTSCLHYRPGESIPCPGGLRELLSALDAHDTLGNHVQRLVDQRVIDASRVADLLKAVGDLLERGVVRETIS